MYKHENEGQTEVRGFTSWCPQEPQIAHNDLEHSWLSFLQIDTRKKTANQFVIHIVYMKTNLWLLPAFQKKELHLEFELQT